MPATKRQAKSQSDATLKRRGRKPISQKYPQPPEGADCYTILEVAAKLRVHEDTVRRMIYGTDERPPVLDHFRPGGSVRISRQALEAYVSSTTVKAGTTKVSAKARKRFEGE